MELRDRALNVYRLVWNEFYAWEIESSRQTLESLAHEGHLPPGPVDFHPPDLITDGDDTYSVFQLNTKSRTSSKTFFADVFQPYPTYESCTPSSRNISPNPELLEEERAFIPYAQNVGWEKRAEELESFAWQDDFKDPDSMSLRFLVIEGITHHVINISRNNTTAYSSTATF
jgi:hypothetical protein